MRNSSFAPSDAAVVVIGIMETNPDKPRSDLRWGVPASVAFHALLAGLLIFGLPLRLPQPPEEEVVAVELVEPPETPPEQPAAEEQQEVAEAEPEPPPPPEPEPEAESEPQQQEEAEPLPEPQQPAPDESA